MKNNNELAKKYFQEAQRYYRNAKQILKDAKIQYDVYVDTKPVAEASGLCYLSVLKALDGYLILRGIEEKNLPQTYQGYLSALSRYLAHNGKIKAALKIVYQHLHIFGYYRDCVTAPTIKIGFECAKLIIDNFSKTIS